MSEGSQDTALATPVEEATVKDIAEIPEDEDDYVCPPEFDTRIELCKMFVGGLAKEATDDELKTMFEKYGEVKEAVVMRRNEAKLDRLFGFVTFAKCDNLDDCLLARPHKYKERVLDVKRAVPKGINDQSVHYKVKKLHLGNVPQSFDTEPLLKYLKSRHPKKYGTIEEIDILKAKDESGTLTEKNRGFGFIKVSSEDFADRISIAESKFFLEGNSLRINKAKPKGSEDGAQRGGYRAKGRGGFQGGQQSSVGSWADWGYGGYGAGYGYGYGDGYGYGAYDYYGYSAYPSYGGPPRGSGYGRRFAPY